MTKLPSELKALTTGGGGGAVNSVRIELADEEQTVVGSAIIECFRLVSRPVCSRPRHRRFHDQVLGTALDKLEKGIDCGSR